MLILLGLVTGTLVGLFTSLLRAKLLPAALILSTLIAIGSLALIGFFGVGAVLAANSEAVTNYLTLALYLLIALGGTALMGGILGALLHPINRVSIWNNMRALLLDFALVGFAAGMMYLVVDQVIRIPETRRQEIQRREIQQRIDGLVAKLPPKYRDVSSISQNYNNQVSGKQNPRLPSDVFHTYDEIAKLRKEIQSSYGHPYSEDLARQRTIPLSTFGGWLASIFLWPLLLRPKAPLHTPTN